MNSMNYSVTHSLTHSITHSLTWSLAGFLAAWGTVLVVKRNTLAGYRGVPSLFTDSQSIIYYNVVLLLVL